MCKAPAESDQRGETIKIEKGEINRGADRATPCHPRYYCCNRMDVKKYQLGKREQAWKAVWLLNMGPY